MSMPSVLFFGNRNTTHDQLEGRNTIHRGTNDEMLRYLTIQIRLKKHTPRKSISNRICICAWFPQKCFLALVVPLIHVVRAILVVLVGLREQ